MNTNIKGDYEDKGFRGISFPFRIGVKGGVVMSTTSVREVPHITEAMQQILLTKPMERCMEYDFKSEVINNIFDINDEELKQLVAYRVKEALEKWEDRIEVLDVEVTGEQEEVIAHITFRVIKYNTVYNTKLKVGDLIV